MHDLITGAMVQTTGERPDIFTIRNTAIGLDSLVVAVPFTSYRETLDRVQGFVREGGYFLYLFFEDSERVMFEATPSIIHNAQEKLKITQETIFFDSTLCAQQSLSMTKMRHFVAIVTQKGRVQDIPHVLPQVKQESRRWFSWLFSKGSTDDGWKSYFDWTAYNPCWQFTKQAEGFLPKLRALKVLDAGCGAGPDTVDIIETFAKATVLGIDSDATAEAYVKRRLRPQDELPRFTFMCADLAKYPAAYNTYDLIICRDVLGFIQKDAADNIVRNLQESLAPGGIMAVTFFAEGNQIEGALSCFTLQQVSSLFQQFIVLQSKELDFVETAKTPPQRQHIISLLVQKSTY